MSEVTGTEIGANPQVTHPTRQAARRRSVVLLPLLAAAIALGVGLRLKHYFARNAYWHDEASLVLNVFEKSAAQLLGPLESAQAAAPAFLLLERGMYVLFGRSELALRLPPLLAALAGFAVFARLAWRLLPPRAALIMIVLWACGERLIWHAVEAKQYSLDVLVAVGLLAVALRDGSSATRRLIACASLAAIGIWFSHPTAFVFGGISLALLPAMWRGGRGATALWLACNALFAGSFLALYFISVREQQVTTLYDYWAAGFIDLSRPWMIPIWFVRQLLGMANYALDLGGPVLLPLAIAGGYVLRAQRRTQMLGMLLMPAALVLLAAALRQYPFNGSRLTLFLTPSVFLLAGLGLAALFEWTRQHADWQWLAIAVPGYLLAIAAWHAAVYLVRPPVYGNMPAAVQYVAAHDAPGDTIFTNKPSEFRCYWPDATVRDARELVDHVPDGRFWVVLSYMAGRSERVLPHLLDEVNPEAQRLDTFRVPGSAAMLFDGIDGPSTQPTAAAANPAAANAAIGTSGSTAKLNRDTGHLARR